MNVLSQYAVPSVEPWQPAPELSMFHLDDEIAPLFPNLNLGNPDLTVHEQPPSSTFVNAQIPSTSSMVGQQQSHVSTPRQKSHERGHQTTASSITRTSSVSQDDAMAEFDRFINYPTSPTPEPPTVLSGDRQPSLQSLAISDPERQRSHTPTQIKLQSQERGHQVPASPILKTPPILTDVQIAKLRQFINDPVSPTIGAHGESSQPGPSSAMQQISLPSSKRGRSKSPVNSSKKTARHD